MIEIRRIAKELFGGCGGSRRNDERVADSYAEEQTGQASEERFPVRIEDWKHGERDQRGRHEWIRRHERRYQRR